MVMPRHVNRLQLYEGKEPLFADFLSRLRGKRGRGMVLPALLLLLAFFVVPVALLLSRSVTEPELGLQNYRTLLASGTYAKIFFNTFLVAALVTVITALLAFPVVLEPLLHRLEVRLLRLGYLGKAELAARIDQRFPRKAGAAAAPAR